MKTIPLTKSYFTKVDDKDYKKFAIYRWHACVSEGKARAVRAIYKNRKRIHTQLSRIIMNAPKRRYVDHINGDTLDNRRVNLRLCSLKENGQNVNVGSKNTSGYKGVTLSRNKYKKWRAYIKTNGKQIGLKSYKTKEEAAIAYNNKAVELFGKFAKLNILPK